MKVLVIGLNPSKKGGTSSSLRKLYSWMDILGLTYVSFINLYEDYEINYKNKKVKYIQEISNEYDRILCLGSEVSKQLKLLNHFKLPHPSGLNRQLNNPKYVTQKLKECRKYLWT